MDFQQVSFVIRGVDLGGRKVGVAKQLLNGLECRTPGQQMSGKGVAQGIRIDASVDPRPLFRAKG